MNNPISISVIRNESCFDRACESAFEEAVRRLRSKDDYEDPQVRIEFISYSANRYDTDAHEHFYRFAADRI